MHARRKMAPRTRFERVTCALTVRRIYQLSYRGKNEWPHVHDSNVQPPAS